MPDTTSLIDKTRAQQAGITPEGWLTDSWYLAAVSADVKPGTQVRKILLGEPIVLARTDQGEAFALRDICPHRMVPLSTGRQVDTDGQATLECPYHGWRFGTDGVCRFIPALTDDSPYEPEKIKVRRYPVYETNGALFIFIPSDHRFDGTPDVPPPDFGALPDQPNFVMREYFECRFDDALYGLIDPGHVAYVHNQWWWRPPSAGYKTKEKRFVPMERGWAIEKHSPSSNSKLYRWVFGDTVETEICFQLPGFRWEKISNEKATFLTLTCMTPKTEFETHVTQLTWWVGAPLISVFKPLGQYMGRKFLSQDKRVTTSQTANAPYQSGMILMDDVDTQSKWYLKAKKEWAASRDEGRDFVNPVTPTTLRWRS
ncbi:MAG: aromatic ring-hydroxylating dioxygenase subunit alpha [Pseudomonadota bacterium]